MSPKPRPRAAPQPDPAPTTGDLGGLVARTLAMLVVVDGAKKAAIAGLTTILLGETGTGKSVLARRMHVWTGRDGEFVEVNCSHLNGNLAESELFGHTRGAFTGADRAKRGCFKEAHDGTLFLDEVGELSLEVQAKLLTAVDTGTFRPVGSDKAVRADVYLVVATHRDLKAMVAAGTFREDLYYRLLGSVLTVPPLRERTSEIAELLEGIFARHPREDGQPWRLGEGALAVLHAHRWPGNIRELSQLGHRAVATLPGPVIEAGVVRELLNPGEALMTPRAWVLQRLRVGPLGRSALFEGFAGSMGTLKRAITALVVTGAVTREGSGRNTTYALADGVQPQPEPVDTHVAARRWLAGAGETSSGALAEALGMGNSTAKRVVSALVEEGLVERGGQGRGANIRWVGPRDPAKTGGVVEVAPATRGGDPTRASPEPNSPPEVVDGADQGELDGQRGERAAVGGHRITRQPWAVGRTLQDLPERDRRALQVAARDGQLSRRALTQLGVPARSGSRVLTRLALAGLIHHKGAGGWATAYDITQDGMALVGTAPAVEPPPALRVIPTPAPAPRPVGPLEALRAATAISLAARQGRLFLLVLALVLGPDAARLTTGLLVSAGLLVEVGVDEYVLTAVARPPPDEL